MRNWKYSRLRVLRLCFLTESLKCLNARFGLTLSLDEVLRKVIYLFKYPRKNPAYFMQPETEFKVTRTRRRRRIRTSDRWNNKYEEN